jgi:uncharacterized membrane protein
MEQAPVETATCAVCGQSAPRTQLIPANAIGGAIAEEIRRARPAWSAESSICAADLNRLRGSYVRGILEAEKGELSALEAEVVKALSEHELLSRNTNDEVDSQSTAGQRVADRVAAFGGSWSFIISFGSILVLWVGANSIALLRRPFDPYPFILLNLVLFSLAALQAPIIMMSQNRQEQKDRLRAEHDYQVNLKAEIEVRTLTQKLDHLLHQEWQGLLAIQQIQTEMMEELVQRAAGAGNRPTPSGSGDRGQG